jgi:Transcriptional regulator, AbiEi antitoxin
LQVTGRDVTEGRYAVSFDGGVWALDGAGLAEAARAAEARRATAGLDLRAAAIADHVNSLDHDVTPAEAAEALGLDPDMVGKYLRRLVRAGRLTRAGRGRYAGVRSVRMSESSPASDTTDTREISRADVVTSGSDTSDTPLGEPALPDQDSAADREGRRGQ